MWTRLNTQIARRALIRRAKGDSLMVVFACLLISTLATLLAAVGDALAWGLF